MTSSSTPLTLELLKEFLGVKFQVIDKKLDHHEELIEVLAREVSSVQNTLSEHTEILSKHTELLNEHTKILNQHTERFDQHTKRFDYQDELIETIAREVSGTQDLLTSTTHQTNDHESRIRSLEREVTRLTLKTH